MHYIFIREEVESPANISSIIYNRAKKSYDNISLIISELWFRTVIKNQFKIIFTVALNHISKPTMINQTDKNRKKEIFRHSI